MIERDLLVDCLRRLNRTGVTYFLTGSMASNYWGIPRTTHDFDFVIQLPPSSIPSLVAAFQNDFYIEEEAVLAVYQPPHQFNAIDTRSALKIDFCLSKPGAFDQETLRRRGKVMLFEEAAWISSAEDVILNKLLWYRLSPSDRQLADIAGIVAVQSDKLDKHYLEQWGSELGVQDELFKLLSRQTRPKSS